ncbi:molybdopterin synthase catalytic subunit [Pseudomonas fluvialis]|uniref:Molybdopterin synthase catalytic subunit n=1 Tax=Pseudomonas fluvialis TaxID=1793966 RepID=A0A7X0BPS4_9PSED|nr:molybdenum cofactor biosynthesis protein MoaE [Pseudomonas fluvialis]MBB6340510.1 molybdopterin synthase catalytic subunit [Pseudomonas fluvialis]
MAIYVQKDPFDPSYCLNTLQKDSGVGALVTFVGYVRDINEGMPVQSMYLEHYPGVTEQALGKIADQAQTQWPLLSVDIYHRVGNMSAGEPIVFVGVCSAHRQAAFDACNFIMDYLKTRAPLWKQEHGPRGSHWVEGRDSDLNAAARWDTLRQS